MTKVEKYYRAVEAIHRTSSELTGRAEELALLIRQFTGLKVRVDICNGGEIDIRNVDDVDGHGVIWEEDILKMIKDKDL